MDGQPEFQQALAQGNDLKVDSRAMPGPGSAQQLRFLRERLNAAASLEQLYQIASQQFLADGDWLTVAHIQLLEDSDSTAARIQTVHSVDQLKQEELDRLTEICVLAAHRKSSQVTGLATRPGTALIAVPLTLADSRSALAAVVTLNHSSTDYVDYLELFASRVELQTLKVKDAINTRQLGFASGLLGAVRRVQAATDVEAAMELAAQSVSELFGATGIITFNPDPATSNDLLEHCSPDARSVDSQVALDAAHEAIAHAEVISWSQSDKEQPAGTMSLKQLGEQLQLNSVLAASWRDPSNKGVEEQAGGTLMIAGAANDVVGRRQVHAAASAFLPAIHAVAVQQKGLWALAKSAGRRVVDSSRNQFLFVLLVAAAATLLVRRPYQIKCDCTLEPVVRRFVSAPVDAPLEETLVRPGDVVEEGQLLATLDGRDLRWELAGIQADLEKAWKERDTHLAAQRFAEAETSRLEATQLELRNQLITQHLKELEVRSPFDGVIIAGDLDNARGVRLTTGEQLFEIAPLNDMIVEIAIPESDISYVDVGSVLEVRMDAYSDQTLDGVLERIHPRSEVRDGANVFIGEVRFVNEGGQLKPGMKGRVSIRGPVRSIGWSLFHRAAEESLLWLGW